MKIFRVQLIYLFAVILASCATQSNMEIRINNGRAYSYYYPKSGNYYLSNYRNWFDLTFFSAHNVPTLTDEQRTYRSALAGDSDAIHSFFHNQYREEPGEFSIVWANQVLLLLITLGDKSFVKHLSLEDSQTQRIVAGNLRALTMSDPKEFANLFPDTEYATRRKLQ